MQRKAPKSAAKPKRCVSCAARLLTTSVRGGKKRSDALATDFTTLLEMDKLLEDHEVSRTQRLPWLSALSSCGQVHSPGHSPTRQEIQDRMASGGLHNDEYWKHVESTKANPGATAGQEV